MMTKIETTLNPQEDGCIFFLKWLHRYCAQFLGDRCLCPSTEVERESTVQRNNNQISAYNI